MSKPILYFLQVSPPSRGAAAVAKEIGLDIEIRKINLFNNNSPTNKTLAIPFLEDNGKLISDSNLIVSHLVDKYAKTDELYPKDILLRAKTNSILQYQNWYLYNQIKTITDAILYQNCTEVNDDTKKNLSDTLKRFQDIVSLNYKYVSGNRLTIADMLCLTTITNYEIFVPIDTDNFESIVQWRERVIERIPYFKESEKEAQDVTKNLLRQKLEENRKTKWIENPFT